MDIGIKEAAKRLKTSPANIRFMIKAGKLQAEKKAIEGSKVEKYVIKESDLKKVSKTAAPRRRGATKRRTEPRASVREVVFNWIQRHPQFQDLTIREINNLIDDLT